MVNTYSVLTGLLNDDDLTKFINSSNLTRTGFTDKVIANYHTIMEEMNFAVYFIEASKNDTTI